MSAFGGGFNWSLQHRSQSIGRSPAAPAVKRQAEEDRGQRNMAMTNDGKNRIIIYGPKRDGTYVVEFKTAAGEALAISVPVSIRS